MANLKIQKLEKQIERQVAKIILEDVKADVGFVTITGVDLTNDLSFAKVYYTILGNEEKRSKAQQLLDKSKGYIRTSLGSRVEMRKLPELIFVYDDSIEYGNKIEGLIKQIKDKDTNINE